MMNNPLIEQIYDKRKDNYKDIRHLRTEKAINKRLDEIGRLINKIPASKRVMTSNKRYKCLMLEKRLLTYKKAIYTDKGPVMALIRWELQLTDKQWWQEKESEQEREAGKKEHILPLLNLLLIKQTDDQLRQILAS